MRINELLSEQELSEFGGVIPALGNIAARTGAKILRPVGKGILKLSQRASGYADDAAKASSKGGKNLKATGKVADTGTKVATDGFATFNKATGRLLLSLKALGIGKMCYDYYQDMEDAVAMVKKGKWSPEQYHDFRQERMATLVGQLAVSTVLFGTLKLATGWTTLTTGMRLVPYAPIANLGKLLSNLDSAATVGLMAYLNTESGKKVIAEIIGECMIDQTLGDAGTALVDKFKKIFKIGSEIPDKEKQDPEKPAADDAAGQGTSQQGQGSTPSPTNKLPDPGNPKFVTSPSGRNELWIDPRFANIPASGRTLADMEAEKNAKK